MGTYTLRRGYFSVAVNRFKYVDHPKSSKAIRMEHGTYSSMVLYAWDGGLGLHAAWEGPALVPVESSQGSSWGCVGTRVLECFNLK